MTGLEIVKTALAAQGMTQADLAEILGLSKQAVNQWKVVPAKYVLDISGILGLPPEIVRPDVFAPDAGTRHASR